MANKVYKGRQKLNLEQASNYYKHAYKIGVDHGRFEERDRIIKLLDEEELVTHPKNFMKNYDELVWLGIKEQLINVIKGEQK